MHLKPLLATCLILASLAGSTSSHTLTQGTVPHEYAATPGTSTFLGPFVNAGRTAQANFAVLQIASVPVPEPDTALLFAAGVLAVTVQRQRSAHRA